jgi:serine/threonine-protein kinase
MLVDGEDRRIDEGPTEVVDDPSEKSGTTTIVNGVSCMGCHKDGMMSDFKDMVRDGTSLTGTDLQKVLEIYPEEKEMNKLVAQDRQRFLEAVRKTTSPFLPPNQASAEPISSLAPSYIKKNLKTQDVALELGLKDTAALKTLIAGSQTLRSLGLAPLLDEEQAINRREGWEKVQEVNRPGLQGCFSIYQQVAHELRLGEPMPVEKPAK